MGMNVTLMSKRTCDTGGESGECQQGDKGIETEMQAFERQGRKESTAHRNMEKKKREKKSNKAVNN